MTCIAEIQAEDVEGPKLEDLFLFFGFQSACHVSFLSSCSKHVCSSKLSQGVFQS
jgi:hypothetical protein